VDPLRTTGLPRERDVTRRAVRGLGSDPALGEPGAIQNPRSKCADSSPGSMLTMSPAVVSMSKRTTSGSANPTMYVPTALLSEPIS
jgi:hypothetical protein